MELFFERGSVYFVCADCAAHYRNARSPSPDDSAALLEVELALARHAERGEGCQLCGVTYAPAARHFAGGRGKGAPTFREV